MKPLHRIAIVLGVAQVAVLAAAARHRPPHDRPHRSHGCGHAGHAGHAGHGPHHHRHGHHRDDTPADATSTDDA
ncbi:hypothetical protein [Salsipaludibacter albus]|uniref:hypothetical protein n=1 Tax=Salsipaludibacter albus TaxID=2849650 RepID=UPI001EE3CE5B|nr:hypothetical protein [Salsipaludibacter albus]MBY5163481.1 hypothetical protein [Salsipaludibacter albus]